MTQLKSSEKEQLSKAVDSITEYCADGMSPDDAIIKTAKDMKFTKDRLPILVNIYNIGATAQQWNSGDDPRTKAASFPVANIDNIRKKLYPQTTKCAAKNTPALNFSMPSLSNEDMLACYRPPRRKMGKAAAASINIDKVGEQLLDAIHISEEQCKREAHEAYAKADLSLQKLAGVLSQAGMPGRESIEHATHVVYGSAGDAILQCVQQSYPVRTKYASVDKPLPLNHPFFAAMDDAIRKVEEAGKAYAQRDLVLEKCAKAHEKYKDQWKTVLYGNEIERLVLTPAQAKEAELKKKMNKSAAPGDSSPVHDATLTEILARPETQGASDVEAGIIEALDDDNHVSRLRNIMTETIFTDLLNTDESLKNKDPEEVLEAYNDLLEVDPSLAGKKMLLRQALRQYLDSETLDLPTIGQLKTIGEQFRKPIEDRKRRDADIAAGFAEQQYKRRIDALKLEMDKRDQEAKAKANDAMIAAKNKANAIQRASDKTTAAKNKADVAIKSQAEKIRSAISKAKERRDEALFPFEMARNFGGYRNMAHAHTVRIPNLNSRWEDVEPEAAITQWSALGAPQSKAEQIPDFEDVALGG